MRKKRIIISMVVVICVLVGSFFIMRFDVIGKIRNVIEKEGPEELRYETELDKKGNEYLVEMKKVIGINLETGEEVEIWVETAEPKNIYNYFYEGEVEKIGDNKIYFMVDKESKDGDIFCKDVEDYQIVFDIDTFDFKKDPHLRYWPDFVTVYPKDSLESTGHFYSTEGLEFLVGKYLRVQDAIREDYYTGDRYKDLVFFLQ